MGNAEESEPAPTGQTAQRIPLTPLAVMVASGVALVCSFLPWAKVFLFTVSGTDGDGMLTAVGSGVALGCVLALFRIETRRPVVALVAAIGAALSAGTYAFDLVRIARLFNDDATSNSIFGGGVSVGFGLVVGAAASGAALVAAIVLAAQIRRVPDVRAEHADWNARRLTIAMLAGATLTLCAAERVWVLSIVLAVGTAVCWVLFTRPVLFKGVVGPLAAVAVVAGVAGGVFGAVRSADAGPTSCDDVFVDGGDVDAIAATDACEGADGMQFVFTIDHECYDGTTLYVNDNGWGYGGKTWNVDGDAPVDECTTSATQQCSEMFADGVETDSSWEWTEPECFGADGKPVSVPVEWEFCEDFSTMLSNEFGWGKEGEPWHAGESKPSSC